MSTWTLAAWPDAALGAERRERVSGWAEAAAAGQITVLQALARIHREVLPARPADAHPNRPLRQVAAAIAAAAWADMSTAFSLWGHRMVMEYLATAPPGAPARERWLPELQSLARVGSTALAPALRRLLLGTALPVTARREGDRVRLRGRLPWASNLFEARFLMVTAAVDEETGRCLIVAVPGDLPGVRVEACGELLALQATATGSVCLDDAAVPAEWVVAEEFGPFMQRIRPPFLLLQSGCCWGLGARSLHEARQALHGINEVFQEELDRWERQRDEVARRLWDWSDPDALARVPARELVRLRLDALRLATGATALESKVSGGRGYLAGSPTARRCLEALFFPVQSPTEAQLVWELSRSG